MTRSRHTENKFVIIMGKSDFNSPYQAHSALPASNTANINGDTSAAFFFLIVVMICGTLATEVQTPAATPMNEASSIKRLSLRSDCSSVGRTDHRPWLLPVSVF